MRMIFFTALNMSLSASVICAVILLLRVVLRKKLPRWLFYCLWGLVLARLLLPLSLPSRVSAFGAIPAAHPTAAGEPTALVFVEDSGAAVSFPTLQIDPAGHELSTIAPAPVEISTILTAIWLCGALLLLVYSGSCYCYTMYRLKTAQPLAHTPQLDTIFRRTGVSPDRVRLYCSTQFDSPVVCGLLRPKLILSATVEPQDLPHVVAHELTHVRRCDNLWKALATLALYLHWFNPLLWYCYRSYVTDMEASCDEAVVRRSGCDRKAYAGSLLRMAVKSQSAFSGGVLAFGECALKERVRSIMNVQKYAVIVTIVCMAMILGLSAVFLTNPQSKPQATPATVPSSSAVTSSEPPQSSAPPATASSSSATSAGHEASSAGAVFPAQSSAPIAASHPTPLPDTRPLTLVIPRADNPPAFQLNYDDVDYVNLIDREHHVYCSVSDSDGKAALVNALNQFNAQINTTDQPDPQKLRLLQLRFRDGSKREYWLHNNLIMVDGIAYKMNDHLRVLYNLVVDSMSANEDNMGVEWLGFMNPYRITELIFHGSPGKIYTATATDEQRGIILEIAELLKALIVQPASVESISRATLPGDLRLDLPLTYAITLDFDAGKAIYTIGVYEDGSVSVAVDNIAYLLSYDTEQNATLIKLTKALQKYATD